jgi:hypothetical protein
MHRRMPRQRSESPARFASADAAFQIAEVYAWRGDTEQVFCRLDRAYVQRDGGLATMKTNPILASLRSDARYKALLGKMNLLE